MFAVTLVYNHRRLGEFLIGDRRFRLRRVRFPKVPSAEWSIVDLLENHQSAGIGLTTIEKSLRAAVQAGRFNRRRLAAMAATYGTRATRTLLSRCLE